MADAAPRHVVLLARCADDRLRAARGWQAALRPATRYNQVQVNGLRGAHLCMAHACEGTRHPGLGGSPSAVAPRLLVSDTEESLRGRARRAQPRTCQIGQLPAQAEAWGHHGGDRSERRAEAEVLVLEMSYFETV